MKKLALLFCLACFAITVTYAQDAPIGKKVAIGFQLNQYQDDFGIGLNLSSPYFIKESVALRVRGNLNWHQHITFENETTWSPYFNVSLGVVAFSGQIGDHIRLYSEGGVLAIFPSTEFSDESSHIGGYGLFGFEFFMATGDNYFIELGGIGIGATADKVPGEPIYSNGFMINVGYRYQF